MSAASEGPIDLAGRGVVVTGGAGGLGMAMARALVAAGARVALVDFNAAALEAGVAELGNAATGILADLSGEDGVNGALAEIDSRFGTVDVLINNAGIGPSEVRDGDRYTRPIRYFEVTHDHLRRFLGIHVVGPFLLNQALAPLMVERGFGRIVTVTTSISNMVSAGSAPYGPVKAASEAFTSVLAGDLRDSGVTVNVLVPGGAADTNFVPVLPNRPRELLVQPVVMGAPAVWLASDESGGVTARRFVGRLWDVSLARSAAAAIASFPIAWPGGS